MTTFAPTELSSRTHAAPKPEAPPVTRTPLFSSCIRLPFCMEKYISNLSWFFPCNIPRPSKKVTSFRCARSSPILLFGRAHRIRYNQVHSSVPIAANSLVYTVKQLEDIQHMTLALTNGAIIDG